MSCNAAGIPSISTIIKNFKLRINRQAYGAGKGGKANFKTIIVRGKSAILKYNTKTKYQVGNAMCRKIIKSSPHNPNLLSQLEQEYDKLVHKDDLLMKTHPWSDIECFVSAFLQETTHCIETFFPLFLGTEFVLDEFLQKMDFATNVVNRHESEMNIHLDTKSKYPTVLSRAIIDTDGDMDGGELVLVNNGFVCDYVPGDLVFLLGSQVYHNVLPFSIRPEDPSSQNPTRFSCAFYNNHH